MADPTPTTWRSGPTPICATDEMIEAGVAALVAFLDRPPPDIAKQLSSEDGINSAIYNRRKVEIVLAAALKAIPKPIENDPEAGDRTDG